MSVNPLDDTGIDDTNDDDIEIEVPVDAGEKRVVKIIPKGEQTLRIIDWEKTTSGTGNPQIVMTLQSGGLRMKEWFSLVPTAMWKLANLIMAVDPDVKPGDKLKLSKEKYIGRQFLGSITHERSGEFTNARLGKVKPHPDGFDPKGDDLPF